jgi:hypothetical protein
MASVEFVILTTPSRHAAREALRELKRLDHEGWIDLVAYELVERDEGEALLVRETSGDPETLHQPAAKGLAGSLAGSLAREIQPGGSAVLVLVEQRYAERVAQEFESRGHTQRDRMQKGQCESALRKSIESIKGKIVWLEELIDREGEKLAFVYGEEKERLEAGIRAGRNELAADRDHLQSRLLALRMELEARLAENERRAGKPDSSEATLAKQNAEIEREIADINEDLVLTILSHLTALTTHAAELRERAARSGTGAATEIEEQLEELDLNMRKCRADLTATLASSASLAQAAERHKTGMGTAIQEHIKRLEQRHALLKADIQQAQNEDSRDWNEARV